ncbi:MAG TPA: asparaginase [Gaiellaceae bacterium]|nr:asparaginase [Gaiellaceae bacterium]
MDPISVTVRRGTVVEAVHRVHAVAVEEGRVVEAAGDPQLVSFFRSSSKPIQALPLAREREDVTDEELAIACASHRAGSEQLAAAASLLARAPATEDDFELGPQEGREPSLLGHNCSGKHAGFLAVCRARGWPTRGYVDASHPLQQLLHEEIAAAAELSVERIPAAIDGCGVLTFALTLERMAHSFSRLERLAGGARIAQAMRAHAALIGHEGGSDTELMRARPGWIAKAGAEGLLCVASPEGRGVALKAEDGAQRALRPALARFLGLGEDLAVVPLENSRGERVGEIVAA